MIHASNEGICDFEKQQQQHNIDVPTFKLTDGTKRVL